ncbi:hypothetical protein [Agromyces sp. NPDC056965]|uniref:hypothetical protein n=1 Tax=Agromyces sp. NPDC056965 TaxID=3345983 RepID=UPI003632EC58
MSDDATSGLDPRFDPRYQRGYDGHGVSGVAADAAAPPPRSVEASKSTPSPAPGVDRVPQLPIPAAAEPRAAEEVDGAVEQLVREFGPGESEPDGPAGTLRPWLIAAWALLGSFVVVGVSLIWTVNNDVNLYTGLSQNNALRDLSWMAAPALVRVGLLGAVALLAALTVRRIRSAPLRSDSVSRYPAFLGLIGMIAAAILLVAYYVTLTADGRLNNWNGAPDEELVQMMAVQQTVNILTTAAVEAALWSAVALLALCAVSRISAARARPAQPDRP